MSEHLFAYGTLLPGLVPRELRGVLDRLHRVGAGRLRGSLFDLGAYPGAVPDEAAATWILGEVFRLPDDAALLARLDAYEGYAPEGPREGVFVRVRRAVALAVGGGLDCWVYAYSRDPGGAPPVASGDWRAHLRVRDAARPVRP